MDQMDQYWANIDKGCQDAVKVLEGQDIEVEYKWSAPVKKDDAQQIETIIYVDSQQIIQQLVGEPCMW